MRPLQSIEIAPGRRVGDGAPCFLVAEIGQNHNGDLNLAHRLIDHAAVAGADAVKFCKRDLASELSREAFCRPYRGPNSFAATYGEHRRFLEFSPAEHAGLKRHAQSRGLVYFATACDARSVADLETLDTPLYKIASRDLTNLPLLDEVARTGKPVVLSCGMDLQEETGRALETVRRHHDRVVLLQCTSAYPTSYDDVNLRVMDTLRREFGILTGLSDHSPGTAVPLAAVALGAVMIEKHVTLSRQMKGSDHACSLDVEELCTLTCDVRNVERALGDGVKRIPPEVEAVRSRLGRTLVARCEIAPGTRVTEDMLCLKTAGEGLAWHDRQSVIGKIAQRHIAADHRLDAADVA